MIRWLDLEGQYY